MTAAKRERRRRNYDRGHIDAHFILQTRERVEQQKGGRRLCFGMMHWSEGILLVGAHLVGISKRKKKKQQKD